MQSVPNLGALRRLSWPARLLRGRANASTSPLALADEQADAALCTVALHGERCAAVRLERRSGSARLHLVHAGQGTPDMLRQWQAQRWFHNAQVVLVLDSEQRHFLTLDRPEAPMDEWPLMARYPLAEALEVEAENLLVTATPMPQTNDALRPQMLGVAAHLQAVRELLATFSGAGIPVRNIDIADTALRGMVLLQGRAEEGCVALTIAGSHICIGLIWQHQFCALRSMALPQLATGSDAEFEEQLALHIQRTADHFERQATRLAVRSVLSGMTSLTAEASRSVLSALPLPSRVFELHKVLDVAKEAGRACQSDNVLTALASVAAARLLEPVAQRVAQEALAREAAMAAMVEPDPLPAFEPTPVATTGSELSAIRQTPAALSQAAIGQAAVRSLAPQADPEARNVYGGTAFRPQPADDKTPLTLEADK